MYTRYPSPVHVDQGSAFNSIEWAQLCREATVQISTSGTESHNSLSQGETYHSMLCRVYNKVRETSPKLSRESSLSTAVKVMNDTAGPNGLVPPLLLFGELPHISHNLQLQISFFERHKSMATARKEFELVISRRRVCSAISHRPPTTTLFRFIQNSPVYVYREKEKRWTRPHLVRSCDEKAVHVDLGERTGARQFNLSQLKPARLPSMQSLLHPTSDLVNSAISPPKTQKSTSPLTQQNAPVTFFTEIIHRRDPRTGLVDEAKRKELPSLIERGTFRIFMRSDAGPEPNIIPSRFVLALKHKENGTDVYRARFVVGGHRDRQRDTVVHNTTTLKQSSLRPLLALASILGFDMYSIDVDQAYLQSASKLHLNIFIKPDVTYLHHDKLLQLVTPIYGLTDSGDYWNET